LHQHVGRHTATAIDDSARIGAIGRPRLLPGFRLERVRLVLHEAAIHELSLTLDTPPTRRIPLGRGDLERVAAVERKERLHQTLAEAGLTHHERAVMILERTGHDLAGGRRVFIGHHRNGQRGKRRRAARVIGLRVGARSHAHDLLTALQEQVRHLNALLQDAARVATHVEDDTLHSFLLQRGHGALHFIGRRLVEPLHWYVTDAVVEHDGVRNGGNPDHLTRERGDNRLRNPGTAELDRDLRAFLPDQVIRHLLRLPAAGGQGVDEEYPVALTHTASFRGSVRKHLADGDGALLIFDLHADTGILAIGLLRETRDAEHLVEDACAVCGAAILDEKPARKDGQGYERESQGTTTGHLIQRLGKILPLQYVVRGSGVPSMHARCRDRRRSHPWPGREPSM